MARSKQVQRIVKQLEAFTEKKMRRLILRTFQAVTSATPVKTGFARSGWVVSAGAPMKLRIRGRPADEATAIARASDRLARNTQSANALAITYKLAMGPVFITNDVRYIVFLNRGSSAQAPAMFVERAMAAAVRATKREPASR